MKYYSINGGFPVTQLPKRLRIKDNTTRTDLESLNEQELNAIGVLEKDPPPEYVKGQEKLEWIDNEWKVLPLSETEKNIITESKWIAIRRQRDDLISNCSKLIEQYHSEIRREVTPTIKIDVVDAYVEALRQIPQTQDDPFKIVWPELGDYK